MDSVLTPGRVEACFIFREGGAPIGMVTMHTTEYDDSVKLHWMAVSQRWRRRHYAAGLMAAFARAAQDKSYRQVVLTTEVDKVAALDMYYRFGMTVAN